MADHGEAKVIEIARHITKTLGRTDTMTNDILRIFSDFDSRFSPHILSQPPLPNNPFNDLLLLQHQFHSLLTPPQFHSQAEAEDDEADADDDQIPIAFPITDYNFVVDPLPPGTLSDLHEIAKRMCAAGLGGDCVRAYSLSRQDFLEESVCRLGFRFRANEDEVFRWVKAANVAFRILFPSERRLCRRVFSGLGAIEELSFAEACRGTALRLLRFADEICSSGERSPEKLFGMIDVYEVLRDVVPEIDAVFSGECLGSVKGEVFSVWRRMGAAIRGVLVEFDSLIRRDPATEAVAGGGVHPISRYVMNYVVAACDYRGTLEEVMDDGEDLRGGGDRRMERSWSSSSSFAAQIAWIMEVLQGNLRMKARVYREPGLSCIFLMNNCRYDVVHVSNIVGVGLSGMFVDIFMVFS